MCFLPYVLFFRRRAGLFWPGRCSEVLGLCPPCLTLLPPGRYHGGSSSGPWVCGRPSGPRGLGRSLEVGGQWSSALRQASLCTWPLVICGVRHDRSKTDTNGKWTEWSLLPRSWPGLQSHSPSGRLQAGQGAQPCSHHWGRAHDSRCRASVSVAWQPAR